MNIPTINVHNMANQVNLAFRKCLFSEEEDKTNYVRVEGLTNIFCLHPDRLEEQRELVKACLDELPPIFKEGDMWTGMQRTCQELVVMAIGLDLMSYCLPREVWPVLPGGVPYVIINQ